MQKANILGDIIFYAIQWGNELKQFLSNNKYFFSLYLNASVDIKSFKYDGEEFHREPILF